MSEEKPPPLEYAHDQPAPEARWFRWLVVFGIALGLAMIVLGLLRAVFP